MAARCANGLCSAPRDQHEGKLFRVDIDLGNAAGETQKKTAYVWLCARCAQELIPKIEVAGDTITVRLAKSPRRVSSANPYMARVN